MGIEILPFRKKPRELTPEETDFRLEQVFNKWGLENLDIWLVVVEAVSKRKKKKFIAESEISAMVDVYEATHHLGDISVGELVRAARIADLSKHYFLSKVCFNYDFAVDAKARLKEALVELEEGRRESFDYRDFFDVGHYVDEEFNNWSYLPSHGIARSDLFDREAQTAEKIYWIDHLEGISSVNFFTVREYANKVMPLLGQGEAVKAGGGFYVYHYDLRGVKPKVVRKYL